MNATGQTGQVHYLKIWPEFYEAVESGSKKFEFRVNDRDFRKGDTLFLEEFFSHAGVSSKGRKGYSGRIREVLVTYCLYGPAFGIPEGTVIMSIDKV